jgi:hypothetical protein
VVASSFIAAKSSSDYNVPRTEEEVRDDLMCDFAGIRGAIQGFKRGFYRQLSLEIKPECFGGESEEMGFQAYMIF